MADAPPLAGLRILIAEDNLLVAMQIEDSVRRLGAEPIGPAGRLAAVLKFARCATLGGALLDVDLRGELVFPAAEVLDARGIPIIFATGHDGRPLFTSRFASYPCLRKPYLEQELARLMARLFARA
jgi:DNA-binding LytR/AlgR family response regulator